MPEALREWNLRPCGEDAKQSQHILWKCPMKIDNIQAGKIKLSPAEHGYMVGLLDDDPHGRPQQAGEVVTYEPIEGRAVSGLEKKGLLRRVGDGKAEVLPLGAALLQCLVCI